MRVQGCGVWPSSRGRPSLYPTAVVPCHRLSLTHSLTHTHAGSSPRALATAVQPSQHWQHRGPPAVAHTRHSHSRGPSGARAGPRPSAQHRSPQRCSQAWGWRQQAWRRLGAGPAGAGSRACGEPRGLGQHAGRWWVPHRHSLSAAPALFHEPLTSLAGLSLRPSTACSCQLCSPPFPRLCLQCTTASWTPGSAFPSSPSLLVRKQTPLAYLTPDTQTPPPQSYTLAYCNRSNPLHPPDPGSPDTPESVAQSLGTRPLTLNPTP